MKNLNLKLNCILILCVYSYYNNSYKTYLFQKPIIIENQIELLKNISETHLITYRYYEMD